MPCERCGANRYTCPICRQCSNTDSQARDIKRTNPRADLNEQYGCCPGHRGTVVRVAGPFQVSLVPRANRRTVGKGLWEILRYIPNKARKLTDEERAMVERYSGQTFEQVCREEWPAEFADIQRRRAREAMRHD